MKRVFWIIAVVVCLAPRAAQGDFLRIVPTYELEVDEETRELHLAFSLLNEGDEVAVDVAIELPQLNESRLAARELKPGESVDMEMTLPFDEMRIATHGTYILPYRLLYKDLNFYQFSAPHGITVIRPPAPGRTLTLRFEGEVGFRPIDLDDKETVTFSLQNVSNEDVRVEQLLPFTSVELAVAAQGSPLPVTLAPRDTVQFELTVQNSGALFGSRYVVFLMVAGMSGDKHFAEAFTIFTNVVDEPSSPRDLMGTAILSFVALTFLGWLGQLWWRRRTPASPPERQNFRENI